MSTDYDIRPWGGGFWRWDCRRCRRGVRGSFGVLGRPRGYDDAAREAAEHVQKRHSAPESRRELRTA